MMYRMYRTLFLFCALSLLAGTISAQGWTKLSPFSSKALNGIFSASTSMSIGVGDDGLVFGTTDGGTTWSTATASTTEDLNKVFVFGTLQPVIVCVGDNGTLRYSDNVGITWGSWTSGTTQNLNDIFVHDPFVGTNLTVVGDNGTIIHSGNSGANWTTRTSGTTERLNGVFFIDLNTGVAVGNDGLILRTTDAGVSWAPINSGVSAGTDLKHVFFSTANTGSIVGDGGTILHTTDAGVSWTGISSPTTRNLERLSFGNASNGWAVGDFGVILYTTDAGSSWTQQGSGVTGQIRSVFFVDVLNGFAVGNSGLVLKTTNGGVPVELTSFSAARISAGAVQLRWTTATEENNYGFEVQRENADGWQRLGFVGGSGSTTAAREYRFTDEHPPAAATVRYRLRQIDFDGSSEYSPVVEAAAVLPAEPELHIYPNPAHSSTVLTFSIVEAAHVALRVYTADGRLIATVHDAPLQAGTHTVPWNTASLPAGVYHAILESGTQSHVQRLVVQK